jgi:protein-tyrosine-phosphatase
MAEAFARSYGSDVLDAFSAGLSPAMMVAPQTHDVLREKNIEPEGQFPKHLESVLHERFDLIVNMSGFPLPIRRARVVEWEVRDPIGEDTEFFRAVANRIEALVIGLILDLRRQQSPGRV